MDPGATGKLDNICPELHKNPPVNPLKDQEDKSVSSRGVNGMTATEQVHSSCVLIGHAYSQQVSNSSTRITPEENLALCLSSSHLPGLCSHNYIILSIM